ncbi:ATP-binding protein [Paenibacillus doosanensis]|uniref:ATP-binding protein n=1 Tax=Paenibacillus doosanensis TaxID=1229154 RepID=UPI00217FFED2|nr:ATP-binding protein [Paenibacillus doosanensis]MCS7459707.1 ATP-binding protein [Paenibacillus doosanensis]
MRKLSALNGNNQVNESDLKLDRLASVGQIAAGIAHEVKNPLTAVKGFLQLLKDEAPHKYLDHAYSELENAISTLQNLLHVSKPDLEQEPFDYINLCSELESLLYLFQERSYQVTIHKQFSDTDARVYGKRNQLKKAFFNLLKNAFEAISDHGTITIKHYKSDENVIIKVSDTGSGIPDDKLQLLGTPFYTSKTEGTGMGLAQVFTTIHDHHGTIHVRSEVGVGTEFSVQFPIQTTTDELGVVSLNLKQTPNQNFSDFYTDNQDVFFGLLKQQGRELIETIKSTEIDTDFILESADKVVLLLNERNEHGLIVHAKEHGRNWARHNLDLILKLEWIQMLRKTYWDFLYNFYESAEQNQKQFFELERQVNFNLDSYLKHFASSYSEYKNEVIQFQRGVNEDLPVPVIPLSDHIAILPVVGALDTLRTKKIQGYILDRIYQLQIKQIVIDLSGVSSVDTAMVSNLIKIVNAAAIQGCRAVITGIRPEVTHTLVELGIALHEKVETRGTLQQVLEPAPNGNQL